MQLSLSDSYNSSSLSSSFSWLVFDLREFLTYTSFTDVDMAQTVSNGSGSSFSLDTLDKPVKSLDSESELPHDHSGSFGSSADVMESPDDQSLDADLEISLIELHVSMIEVKCSNQNGCTYICEFPKY